LTDW
jgi:hypothetical protein